MRWAIIFLGLGICMLGSCITEHIPGLYCEKQSDCTDPARPLCYIEIKTCYSPDMGFIRVACNDSNKAERCTGNVPVCGKSGFCEGCGNHSDCASLVCKPDGSCANQADVAYVDNSNGACTGSHQGTKADPVCQVLQALMLNRPTIKLAGSSVAYDSVSINASVRTDLTLLGPGKNATPTAKFMKSNFPAIELRADNSVALNVIASGLDLMGSNAPKSAGVLCQSGSGSISLTLKDSLVHDSGLDGIKSTDCTIVIQQTQVQGNQGVGINTSGGSVTIQQTQVQGNVAGGVTLGSGTTYNIVNNMINLNMSQGVSIAATATGIFSFNTVVMNQRVGGGSAGIECGNGDVKNIQYSIVSGNKLDNGTQLFGKCGLLQTVTGTDNFSGAIQKTPVFVSATDFHLKANDPANLDCCIDKVPAASGLPEVDFDGTKRPQGTAWDIGAHERE